MDECKPLRGGSGGPRVRARHDTISEDSEDSEDGEDWEHDAAEAGGAVNRGVRSGPGANPWTGCAWTPSTIASSAAAGRGPPPQRPGPLPLWEGVEFGALALEERREVGVIDNKRSIMLRCQLLLLLNDIRYRPTLCSDERCL